MKSFYLAKYQQKAKSKKSSSTNKCSYAYDNLAYGYTNDVKQTSETWVIQSENSKEKIFSTLFLIMSNISMASIKYQIKLFLFFLK